jgi:hypothetical protein
MRALLFACALSLCAQIATPVTPKKPEIPVPVLAEARKVSTPPEDVSMSVPRYSRHEDKDELERTASDALEITTNLTLDHNNRGTGTAWQLIVLSDSDGGQRTYLQFLNSYTDARDMLFPGRADASSVELLFRPGDDLVTLRGLTFGTSDHNPGSHTEWVVFSVSATQVLDIADAGLLRAKPPGKKFDWKMDSDDRQAIRWFVWEKVKGGKDLMRARYTIVDKPKAEPATAPKSDGAKEKPAPTPAPAPEPEEKPKRAA